MESQLAVALANGLEYNAHPVPDIVFHNPPNENQCEDDADGRKDEVQVVDILHGKRATEHLGGDIDQVFDDNSGQGTQHTNKHTENQHQSPLTQMLLHVAPDPSQSVKVIPLDKPFFHRRQIYKIIKTE